MTFEVRPSGDLAEFSSAVLSIGQYFGNEPDPEGMERFTRMLPLERMHAAWEDGQVVGGAGAFPFQMSVPGGALQCAGTTVVGVAPTHRRRGVLRAMMRAHLDDAHERGEPIAALWASEETIYGRFGYGPACVSRATSTIPKEYVDYVAPRERAGSDPNHRAGRGAREVPAALGRRCRARGPGMFIRSSDWWELRTLRDPPERRGGAGPKRFALLELDGEPAGYAIYRHKMDWEDGVSSGKVIVVEAIAADSAALAELWRFLLDIDWIATITSSLRSAGSPVVLRLGADAQDGVPHGRRPVGSARSTSALHSRAARIPRTARSCFDVRDSFCPWNEGRWRLAGGAAERTDADADLALDVADARLRLPRWHPLRAARAGRRRRGAEARRRRARRRNVPPRPASVVPGDLLSLG